MKPHDRSSLLRRIILPLLLVFTLTTAHADEKSAKLIRTLSDKIASGKAYEILFTASMENEFSDVAGRIVVSGDRYYVHVNDYELFCDGKLLYTYNSNEDEVTIEKPDPNDHSLLSNPSRFFKMDEQDFDNAYKGSVAVGGRTAERVELTPKVKGAGYRSDCYSIRRADCPSVSITTRTARVPSKSESARSRLTSLSRPINSHSTKRNTRMSK